MAGQGKKTTSRRDFIRYGLGAGVGLGLVGLGNCFKPGNDFVVVPRALPHEDFISRCVRCGACAQVCPTRAIYQRDLTLNFTLIGTPYLFPKRGGCTAWKDGCKKCAEICPSGAIDPYRSLEATRPALVTFAAKDCTNCMACFRACPIPGAVLFPNPKGEKPYTREEDIPLELKLVNSAYKPYIDSAKCVGCGLCAARCIPKIMYLVAP